MLPNQSNKFQQKRRKNPRLSWFDYSEIRSYFFTICCISHNNIFEDIKFKNVVYACWNKIPSIYPSAKLDEFVVMPNHVHGIIWLEELRHPDKKRPNLGNVIGSFKSAVTKTLHEKLLVEGKIWQRNYFERIIRDEEELNSIRKYISENPQKWTIDRENPRNSNLRTKTDLISCVPINLLFNIKDKV
jgi:REP element-mobilizing transposase RayT